MAREIAEKIGRQHLDGGPVRSRTARMQRRKWSAPPSGRSSRVTDVMTTWRRPRRADASATRAGSSSSRCSRLPLVDRAEPAGPGADIAQNHEGGGAASVAFGPIGTAGVLAHRLEPQLVEQSLREEVAVPFGKRSFEPGRQPPGRVRRLDRRQRKHRRTFRGAGGIIF